MRVQLLYLDGCPNWQIADGHLREAVVRLAVPVEVERVLVRTQAEPEAWGFNGSPSVLVDGRDPFAEPGAAAGLSCRLYRTPAGTAGSPTVEQLVEAINVP